MYSSLPHFILAFHGCDRSVTEAVVSGKSALQVSQNSYDWLGAGMYFWENSPSRALEYAKELHDNPGRRTGKNPVNEPSVIGAVIDLGFCLNLLDSQSVKILKIGYSQLKRDYEVVKTELPRNKSPRKGDGDLLLRHLDCAVIEAVHWLREIAMERAFDSVRGMFSEGDPVYPNAGINEKDHIQICVRNPNCIKGFFLPREKNPEFIVP